MRSSLAPTALQFFRLLNLSIYDGNNSLVKTVDPLGNPTTFGYNSQFSLTGQTNGAGDWVNYAYNSDGTLQNRTDSGGTTAYGYGPLGVLISIVYPNGLGTNAFVNSVFGEGAPLIGVWNALTNLGARNRKKE
jgi:YD repeat-containing protein